MRAFAVTAGLFFAGGIAAHAADLPLVYEGSAHYSGLGSRASPLVIYDFEPGVEIRAYWLPPWRNRHYFPARGEMPVIGRSADRSAHGTPPEPAESYSRFWSTSSGVLPRRPPLPESPLK